MINMNFDKFVAKPREAMASIVDNELCRKNNEALAKICYPDDEDLDEFLFWEPEQESITMKRAIQVTMGARPWNI